MPSPFVFLSHSGADTKGARELKKRLEQRPEAKSAGLKVWFDKDDLKPGEGWQPQIEQAIANNATAFVVYVGSRGILNWVDAEVRVALSRAIREKSFRIIPVLAGESAGANALPPFVSLYHSVHDPLGRKEELEKLLKAVLNTKWDTSAKLIDVPFVGLRSMREEHADRFFGREAEVTALVEKFRRKRIVAIVADSGTGKSSLAEAGLIPAFRGGALADTSYDEPDDRLWHVVAMRPGANPEEGLRTGVTEAAERLGLPGDKRALLRRRIAASEPSETAFALQCDLPTRKTATLLIVDQFEEMLTQTPDALCAPFVRLLLALVDGDKDVRVLLTVRSDYFNLAKDIIGAGGQPIVGADGKTLFERLVSDGRAAILPLKRISEEGLRDAIREPLRLAGHTDEAAQDALVKAVRRDISDQPSDLPLLQVALRAAWREHSSARPGLLEAYELVGGVLGALAKEAEDARNRLEPADQARLQSVFVRLVRLGDTGGATRRTARLDEFDPPRRALLRRLGSDECGRLVVVGEKDAEIAHEALITQWPWLQGRLKDDARDARRLDRLMAKALEWSEAPEDRKTAYLAGGAERESFEELARQRADWLSPIDRGFVEASNRAYETEREAERRTLRIARHNESVALTALANIEAEKRPVNAAKLALAAWPRSGDDTTTPKLPETLDVLSKVVPNLRERRVIKVERFLAISPDGAHIIASSKDNTVRIWSAALGSEPFVVSEHEGRAYFAAFSPDGSRVIAMYFDGTASVWEVASGREIATLEHASLRELEATSASFSPDGELVVIVVGRRNSPVHYYLERFARLWRVTSGREIAALQHKERVLTANFSSDGMRVLTASEDGTARIWDAATGRKISALKHRGRVTNAAFSPDGTRIVTTSWDGARVWDAQPQQAFFVRLWRRIFTGALTLTHNQPIHFAAFSPDGRRVVVAEGAIARLWDAVSGTEIAALEGHPATIGPVAFSPDGGRIVTACSEGAVRVWNGVSGGEVARLKGHESAVRAVAFSRDASHILTGSEDGSVRIWDAGLSREIYTLKGYWSVAWGVSQNGAGLVLASSGKTTRLLDPISGREIGTLEGHEDDVHSANFSPEGSRVVTCSKDGTARIWDAASGHQIAALKHTSDVCAAAFSPCGTHIVTGSRDGGAQLWDGLSGRAIATLAGHKDAVLSAVFSPDGTRILTASLDGAAKLWDGAFGHPIATLLAEHRPLNATVRAYEKDRARSPMDDGWTYLVNYRLYDANFSPDGTLIATASGDGTARLWHSVSGRELAVLEGHEGIIHSVMFSSDGARILSVSRDNTARIWDTASGRAIAILRHKYLESGAFSPDCTRIVTISDSVRLWDAASGCEIATLNLGEFIHSAAFSPDGKSIVIGSETVHVWDISRVSEGSILRVACALLRMHEEPVNLEGVTEYPLTFDQPICLTDPPSPDPPEQKKAV